MATTNTRPRLERTKPKLNSWDSLIQATNNGRVSAISFRFRTEAHTDELFDDLNDKIVDIEESLEQHPNIEPPKGLDGLYELLETRPAPRPALTLISGGEAGAA